MGLKLGDMRFEDLLVSGKVPVQFTSDKTFSSYGNCSKENFGVSDTTEYLVSLSKSYRTQYISNNDARTDVSSKYPEVADIQYWFLAAIVLMLVRRVIERYIFIPFGKWAGLKENTNKSSIPCRISSALPLLENLYLSNSKNLPGEHVGKLCTETGLEIREIERWIRKRRARDRPSKLTKFSESGWRLVSYVLSTSIGIWTVWNQTWVWDTKLCLENHEQITLSSKIRIYYLYGSGLYLSYLITLAFDVKRKDFWEMFIHHIITILLLGFTWVYNLTRMAVYTLLIHDFGDIFLEGAKMANYMGKQDLSTGIFVVFTLVWVVTRLIIYPKNVVMQSIQYVVASDNLSSPVLLLLIGMLVFLFGLHIFWTYFICKVAIFALKSGNENQKDSRSSTESDLSDESDTTTGREKEPTFENRKHSWSGRNRELVGMAKKLSLQYDNAAELVETIHRKQRAVMKRISVEIM